MAGQVPIFEVQADGSVVEYWCDEDHQDCLSNAEMSRLCYESRRGVKVVPLATPTPMTTGRSITYAAMFATPFRRRASDWFWRRGRRDAFKRRQQRDAP